MGKLLIYLFSDGWKNTLSFLLKRIRSVFYYQANTFCFYAKKDDIKKVYKDFWKEYDYRIIQNAEDVRCLNFSRLSLLPFEEWIKAGSVLCMLFKNDKPIGFGWIHFHHHTIKNVGRFDLGNNVAWVGPQFVHKNYRGYGLQKLIVLQCIANMPKNIEAVITSVNQSNIPSLHSYEKMNFRKGMKVLTETGIFSSRSFETIIYDTDSLNYLRLTK